jgi:hypothetical protein
MVMGAVIEKTEEAVPPGVSVALVGVRLVVNGEKLLRDMKPENPFRLARSMFAESEPPGGSVMCVLSEVIVKSGPVIVTGTSSRWKSVQPPVACMNIVLSLGKALLGMVIVSVDVVLPPEVNVTMGGFKDTGSEVGNENDEASM